MNPNSSIKELNQEYRQPQTQATVKKPWLNILSQYTKRLSFDNSYSPYVPHTRQNQPEINININVTANPFSKTDFEVELKIHATASKESNILFTVELRYAGCFRLFNIPHHEVERTILIECPRFLFPFARQIVAEVTRNGGIPPLMMAPVDFDALFELRQVKTK
ncbi:protein-export chaperone SecB [Candidatus Endowatersipora endosymbiont of Watersipora subatra]|uniref:protein-export chaperone SecB n=1 Tax=Candidatus Endowatersipora endosymbiont of Watersipora subatra TaxID=3077946 RepID=UPI00312CACFF